MANTRSAKKNVRKNEVRRIRNNARRSAIKTAIKKIYSSLEVKNVDAGQLQELLKDVASKLARAKGKNVLHPNTASRKLSRLAKRVFNVTHAPAA
jgi:small subunit ribosomal protein S20